VGLVKGIAAVTRNCNYYKVITDELFITGITGGYE